jgi:pyruvate dehydrogenase E2 component (dihydrolipoamide acetyltransferase)
MATAVELPQFGNTVEECLITRWIAREGASVSAGEVIAEIETDKTTFEITAPVGGTVLARFFEEGALVPVFTNLCVIGEAGESVEAFRPGGAGDRPGGASAPPQDIRSGGASLSAVASAKAEAPPSWSPRASRFATDRDFHPSSITGSGPGGRVLEDDVRRAYSAPATPSPPGRVSGPRATIARRMRESVASTAQYTLHASADARGLLSVRAQTRASTSPTGVNLNDLIAYCTIQALLEVRDVNAEFINGAILTHEEVHLGFACDTPRGLMVPVVHDAHLLSLVDLARAMKALAAEAIAGTISPARLSGATFTISNLGALGIESFTPLINPPQVAILGVGSIQLKAIRIQDAVEFVESIGLSLTCDHQVIDGAPGARFLQVVKDKIENVELMGCLDS